MNNLVIGILLLAICGGVIYYAYYREQHDDPIILSRESLNTLRGKRQFFTYVLALMGILVLLFLTSSIGQNFNIYYIIGGIVLELIISTVLVLLSRSIKRK